MKAISINLSFQDATVAAVILVLLYTTYWQLTVGSRRRAIIREKGCLPIKRYPTKDPILGIDLFRTNVQNFKDKIFLESIRQRFEDMGCSTFQFPSLGRQLVTTIEPENLKTIQALNFKQWSLGYRRKVAFTPLLGRGIFTTDGGDWQHSRELLRPNFNRSQVRDLDSFETYVSNFIDAIPRDGSTVDLQDLFFRLTIDSATEFLFGESTNCLAPGTSTISNARFAEAFNRGQYAIAERSRYGIFGFLVDQTKFKNDAQYVHGEYARDMFVAARPLTRRG